MISPPWIQLKTVFQDQNPAGPAKPNPEEEHRQKLREKAKNVPVDPKSAVPALKMLQLDCKQGAVRAVRLSVDGMYMMTCGSDKSLKLWNPRKGTQL